MLLDMITDPMKQKIANLAVKTRANNPRHTIYEAPDGPSRSAYTNFEKLKSWPRTDTIERIERALGWKVGIVSEVLSSDLEPKQVTISTLKGTRKIPGQVAPEEQPVLPTLPEEPVGQVQEEQMSAPAPAVESAVELQPAVALNQHEEPSTPQPSTVAARQDAQAPGRNPQLAGYTDYELAKELALRAAAKELDLL